MSKMKQCPVCGKDMAASAKTCPSCGAKNKKPIYKKWWFWALLIVLAAAIGSSAGGGNEDGGSSQSRQSAQKQESSEMETPKEPAEAEITYAAYSVKQLMDDLDSNALRAKNAYQNQYVELTGKLNVIDNNGKYISIVPAEDDYAIVGVHCTIQTEAQLEQVLEMSIGDVITVRGKITDAGEVLGYYLDIDGFGA